MTLLTDQDIKNCQDLIKDFKENPSNYNTDGT